MGVTLVGCFHEVVLFLFVINTAQVYEQTKCQLAKIKTNAKHGVRIKGLGLD